ncbi:MAG: tyrosine-type recombinase/integrase [Rhodocyclales bacterium]|nr:tyrosine-type recombinase/integrase [Rhodocyclales bacterium]
MARKAKELGALEVGRLNTPGLHAVGGVAGLALQVTDRGARSWILRAMVGGKRRDMGLGGYPDVTLAGAKEKARERRDQIDKGIDPIEDRRAKKSALAAAVAGAMTFSDAASAYIAVKEAGWKNAKHGDQWRNTLETYAYPVIGKVFVGSIEKEHILKILSPIWTTKTETASRLRGRIESVLDWATVSGYRKGENPARWRGHLDVLLAAPNKVRTVEHHAALDWHEVGAFMAALRQQEGIAARMLEFAILTAARSGEVRGATWSEIDLAGAVWTIPASRMKAKKEHRIPLSDTAVKLLKALPQDSEIVFLSPTGKQFSDAAMSKLLDRMGRADLTAHGFRSTFRDWAGETTAYPREVIEHALAHQLKDKAEAAYARGSLFDKRRRLMDEWCKFSSKVQAAGMVTPIKGKSAA